jgi:hypothetical protein
MFGDLLLFQGEDRFDWLVYIVPEEDDAEGFAEIGE